MPLTIDEAAQCAYCEQYCRLGQLDKADVEGRVVKSKILKEDDPIYDESDRSNLVGYCPHCDEPVFVKDIC